MPLPRPVICVVLVGFALAACRPAGPPRPVPNPVGQWDWSSQALGYWHLEILGDGTFRREVKGPFDPAPIQLTGNWTLDPAHPAPNWLQRHGLGPRSDTEEALLKAADIDPSKAHDIQWSKVATLVFHYTAAQGAELAPGAVWTGQSAEPAADGTPQVLIEETHIIHTHVTAEREVYLDLEGKILKRATPAPPVEIPSSPAPATPQPPPAPAATPTAPPTPAASATPFPAPPAPPTPAPAPAALEFLNVEPFAGLTLDVPTTWQGLNPDSPDAPAVPVITMPGKPPLAKLNGSWRFSPPEQAQEAYLLLRVQAPIFSPEELAATSQLNLEKFGAGFAKGASHALESKGYFLRPDVSTERTTIGGHQAILCKGVMVDAAGTQLAIRAYAIPTETATAMLWCSWKEDASAAWTVIVERAIASLKLSDHPGTAQ